MQDSASGGCDVGQCWMWVLVAGHQRVMQSMCLASTALLTAGGVGTLHPSSQPARPVTAGSWWA